MENSIEVTPFSEDQMNKVNELAAKMAQSVENITEDELWAVGNVFMTFILNKMASSGQTQRLAVYAQSLNNFAAEVSEKIVLLALAPQEQPLDVIDKAIKD